MKYLIPILLFATSFFALAIPKPEGQSMPKRKFMFDSIEEFPQKINPEIEYKIYEKATECILKDNPNNLICVSDSIQNLCKWGGFIGLDNHKYEDALSKGLIDHSLCSWDYYNPIFVEALAKIKKQTDEISREKCTDLLVFSDIYNNMLTAELLPPDKVIGMFGRNETKTYLFIFDDKGELIRMASSTSIYD